MSFACAEYVCPIHGKFELIVERPVPDSIRCPKLQYFTVEWAEAPCDQQSPWTISAPLGRVKVGEVAQGKVTRAELPTWMDTEPLASGMSSAEWKRKRAEMWRARDQDKRKAAGLDTQSFRAAEEHG